MAEESGSLKAIANLIPSVYYDLIARVSSGVPFLVILFWDQREEIATISSSETVNFIVLLGAGYVAGLLLTPFSWVWSKPIPFVASKLGKAGLVVAAWNWSRNEEIALVDKEAGAALYKMQAELVLCHNLFTGFILLLIVHYSKAFPVAALRDHGTIQCFVLILLVIAAIHRQIAYCKRQSDLYGIHVKNKATTRTSGGG